MNSAPTAELQLPPLEPVLFWIDGMDYMRRQKEQRERQLLTALRENREKDARIAELEQRLAIWEPRESVEVGGSI